MVCEQGYQRAGLITLEELSLIKKVERQPKSKTESILLLDGQAYASLYLRLLSKLQRVDTMQWVLVMIGDAITGMQYSTTFYQPFHVPIDHDERIPLFTRTQQSDPDLPYGPLLRYTYYRIFGSRLAYTRFIKNVRYTRRVRAAQGGTNSDRTPKACIVLDHLMAPTDLASLPSSASAPIQSQYLRTLLGTLSSFVQSQAPNRRDVGVQCLEALLSRPEVRRAVWVIPNVIKGCEVAIHLCQA